MDTLEALRVIERNERVDQSITKSLAEEGYITVEDVTSHDTPSGQRAFMVTSITEKGRQLLDSSRKP
jgi:hypothetical protein